MNAQQVSAQNIRRLMRQYKVSSAQVAAHFNLSLARVKAVRKNGGPWDWPIMIAAAAQEVS